MSKTLELEFVLVSGDYATMNAVSGGVKKYGAKFTLVPTAETALECLNRRKIDGVFIDLAVPGSLELIAAIRKGASNCKAVIFACIASARESTAALNAGGNFLLRKPLSVDSVTLHITIAKELLLREQAVRTIRPLKHTSVVDFAFDLPLGASIRGKGQVAWVNSEGAAGINLQAFHGRAKDHLDLWIMAQEQLALKGAAEQNPEQGT